METKRIILEGVTFDELIETLTEKITEAVKKGIEPERPINNIQEKPMPRKTAARKLGIDHRTLKAWQVRNKLPIITKKVFAKLQDYYS
jgi:hypothetical protein